MNIEPSWILPTHFSLVLSMIVLLACGLVFAFSGLLITFPLHRKGYIADKYFSIASITSSCLIGYMVYLTFLLSNELGKAISILLCFLSSLLGAFLIYRLKKIKKSQPGLARALKILISTLILCLLVSIAYNFLIFGCERKGELSSRNQFCSIVDTTFDNTLPLSFSVALYNGNNKATVSDWKSSDRPPVQSGLILIVLPIISHISNLEINYQLFATFLQCLWIAALIEFLLSVKLNKRKVQLIFLLATTNNFIFVNSVFVWPKLLSGSLVVYAFILLADGIKNKRITDEIIVLATVLATLSLLTHGGVIYTLIPMIFLTLIVGYRYIKIRQIIIAITIFLTFYFPWLIYQSIYYGPGDRLTKWWLAGKIDPDNSSASSSIYQAYANISAKEIIINKLQNVKTLFGFTPYVGPISNKDIVGRFLNLEGSYFIPSLSFSLLAFIGLVVKPTNFKIKQKVMSIREGRAGVEYYGLAVGVASVMFWVILSFGPPNAPTIAYAGSYASFLLIFFSLLVLLSRLSKLLIFAAVISPLYFLVSIGNIYLVNENNSISLLYIFLALVCILLIVFHMRYLVDRFIEE